MAFAGLAVDRVGRPSPCWQRAVELRSTVRSTVLFDKTQFPSIGRPGGRPKQTESRPASERSTGRSTQTTREQSVNSRVDRPVDRQTCTDCACPDTGAGRPGGRPDLPETEKLAVFEVGNFCKNILKYLQLSIMQEIVYTHVLNKIFKM